MIDDGPHDLLCGLAGGCLDPGDALVAAELAGSAPDAWQALRTPVVQAVATPHGGLRVTPSRLLDANPRLILTLDHPVDARRWRPMVFHEHALGTTRVHPTTRADFVTLDRLPGPPPQLSLPAQDVDDAYLIVLIAATEDGTIPEDEAVLARAARGDTPAWRVFGGIG